MKVKQISEHIWSLKTWIIIPIHVWMVKDKHGVTLIDTGIGMMGNSIINQIKQIKAGLLQRILLTHGHIDHVGSIPRIVSDSNVPVFAHRLEIPYINGEIPYPGRKKASITVPNRIIQPLEENDQGQLTSVGGLTPYLTPGHSAGHVVYYHEQDQVLLARDLFTSKKGKLYRPMFTYDMRGAIQSSLIIGQLNPKRVEVCHGDPVMYPAEHLDVYMQQTTKKYVK
jgi:glyoxylase-like metal-dependent hydrolase (beta-lactamase superfamily II)